MTIGKQRSQGMPFKSTTTPEKFYHFPNFYVDGVLNRNLTPWDTTSVSHRHSDGCTIFVRDEGSPAFLEGPYVPSWYAAIAWKHVDDQFSRAEGRKRSRRRYFQESSKRLFVGATASHEDVVRVLKDIL